MPFITIVDTVFQGRVAGWRDEDGKPVIYDSLIEAEMDAADVGEDDEPDMVVEVVVTPTKIYDADDGRIYWQEGESQ